MLTVKVGTAGTYPLGAVPETNLEKGMKLFLYMLVIDDGAVKLGNADFFNMKIAEDSTSGAFFTDDKGTVITEITADLVQMEDELHFVYNNAQTEKKRLKRHSQICRIFRLKTDFFAHQRK